MGRPPPDDSLDAYMDLAISYVVFTRTDNAYEELRQTGNSRFIRNKPLLNQLINLYNQQYVRANEWDAINRDFILQRMIPHLDTHAPYVAGVSGGEVVRGMAPVYRSLARSDQFRNLLKTDRMFKDAQLSVYGAAQAGVAALLKQVNAEIARQHAG